ncbi:MAG: hypothetical protein GXO29_06235 [Thermotogae bacterium]|nr:hypothetical protein [Thermotogota bacterium]
MREAFKALKAASYRSVFAVLGITLSIFIVVLAANATYISYNTYRRIRADIRLEVFPKGRPQEVVSFLRLLGGVRDVEVVDERRAKEEFRRYYPQLSSLLDRLGDDVFYPMVRVYPKEHWKDVKFLDLLKGEIEAYRGVSGAYYGREWLEAAQNFFNFLLGTNVVVLLTALLINLLLAFYTVRFVVHHRRNLIEILRLAGVSPWGLRYPYVLLSLIYALISWSVVAVVVMLGIRRYPLAEGIRTFNVILLGVLLLLTAAITVMGSLRALSDVEKGLT